MGPNVDVAVTWGKKGWGQMWTLQCHGERRGGAKRGHCHDMGKERGGAKRGHCHVIGKEGVGPNCGRCHVMGKEGMGPNVDIQLRVNAQTASNHLPKTGSTVFGRYSSLLFSFFLPSTTSM